MELDLSLFPPTDSVSPVTAAELAAIEAHYGVEYPADVRAVLLSYGPGAFDDFVEVRLPQHVPGVRTFGRFSGIWELADESEAAWARQGLAELGAPINMPGEAGS